MQPYEQPVLDRVLTDYHSPSSGYPRPRQSLEAFTTIPLSKTITNSSTISSSSTTNLLPHDSTSFRRASRWPWQNSSGSPDREKLFHTPSSSTDSKLEPKMKPWQGWTTVLFGSWINVLFVFFPASWLVNALVENSETLVFTFCIFAMIPLVRLHDLTMRELSLRMGGAKTGFINASLSNLIELVVATTAVRKCQLRVVQASLIGSLLSKLLLVLGLCFFAGGLRFTQQEGFDPTTSQIHSSLLSISVGAVLMPAAYHFSLSGGTNNASDFQKTNILKMSRSVAIILLVVYMLYLAFQFYSHSYLFKDNSTSARHEVKNPLQTMRSFRSMRTGASTPEKKSRPSSPTDTVTLRYSKSGTLNTPTGAPMLSPYSSASDISLPLTGSPSTDSEDSTTRVYGRTTAAQPAPTQGATVRLVRLHGSPVPATPLPNDTRHPSPVRLDDAPEIAALEAAGDAEALSHHPRLSYPVTIVTLILAAVLVSLNAERLVEALDMMEETNPNISTEWIGLIVLPTVSVIAECITAMNVSRNDQLTLSISVAVGSSIQTALFVIPLMVIFGWVLDKPMALLFDPFESVVLFISVHTMGYVIADGKSNWLEGALLICLYVIIAVSFWFYPGSTFSSTLGVCAVDPTTV
ncbi:unnamed protein product [Peniophora sp. CBMAI 1063]|nr:unnamed protein product [Peniophora sp. CBMAI 1063]